MTSLPPLANFFNYEVLRKVCVERERANEVAAKTRLRAESDGEEIETINKRRSEMFADDEFAAAASLNEILIKTALKSFRTG